jgi:hypothetical protein
MEIDYVEDSEVVHDLEAVLRGEGREGQELVAVSRAEAIAPGSGGRPQAPAARAGRLRGASLQLSVG